MNVFLSNDALELNDPQKEHWYGAKYDVQPLPDSLTQRLLATTASADDSSTSSEPLHLPAPNWAMPSSLELLPLPHAPPSDNSAPDRSAGSASPAAPTLLVDRPSLKLWHALDVSFRMPKAHVALLLSTPYVYASAARKATAQVLCALLDDALEPHMYHATLLSSGYHLSVVPQGLQLQFYGFSCTLPAVVQTVRASTETFCRLLQVDERGDLQLALQPERQGDRCLGL